MFLRLIEAKDDEKHAKDCFSRIFLSNGFNRLGEKVLLI